MTQRNIRAGRGSADPSETMDDHRVRAIPTVDEGNEAPNMAFRRLSHAADRSGDVGDAEKEMTIRRNRLRSLQFRAVVKQGHQMAGSRCFDGGSDVRQSTNVD